MQFFKLACIFLSVVGFGFSCLDDDGTIFSRNGSVNAAPSKCMLKGPTYIGFIVIGCPMARDCKEWLQEGMNISGVYPVKPDNGAAFQVTKNYNSMYCVLSIGIL